MLNPISGLRPASANLSPISEKIDSEEFAQVMGDASGADASQVDVSGSKTEKDSKNEKEAAAAAQAQQLYSAQLKVQGQQAKVAPSDAHLKVAQAPVAETAPKGIATSGQASAVAGLNNLKQDLKDSIVGVVQRNGKRLNDESQASGAGMNATPNSTNSAINLAQNPALQNAANAALAAQVVQGSKQNQVSQTGQPKASEKQSGDQIKMAQMNARLMAMQQPLNAAQMLGAAPAMQGAAQMSQQLAQQPSAKQISAKQAGPGISSSQMASALNPMTAKDVMGLADDQTLVIPNDGHVMSIIPGTASQPAVAQNAQPAFNNTSTENFLAARMAGQQSATQAAAQFQQNSPILNQAAFNSESSAAGATGASLKSNKKPVPNLNLIHNQVQYNAAGNPMLTMDAPVAKGAGPKTTLSHESVNQLGYAIGGLQRTSPQGGEIKLKLKPNNMGEVKVDVRTEGGKVSLKIEAADEGSRRLIESSLKTLEDGLKNNHGLSLSRVEVLVGQDSRIMQPSSAASSPMDGMSWNAFSGNNASDSGGQKYLDRQDRQNAYEQGQRSAVGFASSEPVSNSWNQRSRSTDQRLDMIA